MEATLNRRSSHPPALNQPAENYHPRRKSPLNPWARRWTRKRQKRKMPSPSLFRSVTVTKTFQKTGGMPVRYVYEAGFGKGSSKFFWSA